METVLLIILLLGLLIAAYRDIKIREVPDTVSYGLIITGLLGAIILSLLANDITIFAQHLLGFLAASLLGAIMYYTRQWGGGDAKLIAGVGAMLGAWSNNYSLLVFFILLVCCGALYGIIMTLWLALVTHRRAFIPAFVAYIRQPRIHRVRIALVITGVICIVGSFFVSLELKLLLGFLLIGTYLLVYAYIFSKVAEQSIFVKEYPITKLTEGDWLAADIVVRKKILLSKNTPGITREDIALLKRKNVKKALVKEGIAFVPAFLLAYICLLLLEYSVGANYLLQFFHLL